VTRALRPRAPTAVAPATVSQLTCAAVLGVDPRRYLDLVVPRLAGRVAHVGRLRVARVDDVLAALAELASVNTDGTASAEALTEHDESEPQNADQFLAALGRRSA
jgi:hypothetical protein